MLAPRSLRNEYRPARIHHSTIPNTGHIKNPSFNDEELGKPKPPVEPRLIVIENWMPMGWTTFLILCFCIPGINILALFGLVGVWIWAIIEKIPKYTEAKQKADFNYQSELKVYKADKKYYDEVICHEWESKQRHLALNQKSQECSRLAIDEACHAKLWRIHLTWEVEENRKKGYIGKGEDDIFQALLNTNISVRHQVQIEPYYTADIVCFNTDSKKLCVVEIDGSQHWLNSECMERDKRRMVALASQGVPTIRFVNVFAANYPYECIKHIQQLLT